MQNFESTEIDFRQFQEKDLIEVSYVSQATQDMGMLGLMNLLEDAVYINKSKEITGVLFYDYGVFGQILEGQAKDVESVWLKISRDIRHKDIRILEVNRIKERNFSNWSMNFHGSERLNKFPAQLQLSLPKNKKSIPKELLSLMDSIRNNIYIKTSASKLHVQQA